MSDDITLSNMWASYGIAPEPIIGDGSSLYDDILDTYGIVQANRSYVPGTLPGIDIKSADALAVIKMALTEPFANGRYNNPIEMVINEDGEAELIKVGAFSGNISDIYTTIEVSNYNIAPTSVKITGKKSQPLRSLGNFVDLLGPREVFNDSGSATGENAVIWDTSQMVNDCPQKSFKRHATITFQDPNLNAWPLNDREEGIFEVSSVWQKVIGWVWYLHPGSTASSTKVTVKQTATVPILISSISSSTGVAVPNQSLPPNIGSLVKRTTTTDVCYEGQGDSVTCGEGAVDVTLPPNLRYTTLRNTQVDNFINISKVYIIGQKLDTCKMYPASETVLSNYINCDSPTTRIAMLQNQNNIELFVGCDDLMPKVYTLDEGIDYGIGYNAGKMCIQLVNNSYSYDFLPYGTNTKFKIIPNSNFNTETGATAGNGSIIPGEGDGYLVQQLWAQAEFSSPSIDVFDPYNNAINIAKAVRLEVAPILLDDVPAPIAIDGHIINMEDGVIDSDPTTQQEFKDTEYEVALRNLNGSQIVDLNMATLDEDQVEAFSKNLYNIFNSDKDLEINYVCGPGASPKIGGAGKNGGIVNSITYSYSDMGSYTISVTEGPMLSVSSGVTSIAGAVTIRQNEDVTVNGTVIQDEGNSVRYKVLLDGMGTFIAYSGVSKVIRKGDTVTVKVYNVPIEK